MKKIALVTGANRGIGLEVVKQLSKRDIQVILGTRNLEKGEKALKNIGNPGNVLVLPLDVTSVKDLEAARLRIENEYGHLDVLINNAGINYDTYQSAQEADVSNVHDTIETNLFGPWILIQKFLPLLKKSHSPRIVNVSSGAGGLTGMAGGAPGYSISKAALNVLTIKLAHELEEHKVLINAVCPGWVRTEMAERSALQESKDRGISTDQVWEERAALYPAGRVVTPREVAEVIAFLASEESSGVNGEAIRVALGSAS